jgi:glucose/arabinose dehydrogenase
MKLVRLLLLGVCLFALGSCSKSNTTPPIQEIPDPTPTAPPSAPPTSPDTSNQPSGPIPSSLQLIPFVRGLNQPLFITPVPGNTSQLYVVEQSGQIRLVENGQVLSEALLDVGSLIGSDPKPEQGLLGLAVHPNFQQNGYIYINYTDTLGDTQIVRYTVKSNRADPASAKPILSVDQPRSNHNGGMLAFGPDGYLYIGMGDGGIKGDVDGYAQSLENLLGKILRIDVNNGDPYAIPPGNPFSGAGGAKREIWSLGWRNPWRFSFDRATGDMWIADVGEESFEEINFQSAGKEGGNYGWRCKEGLEDFDTSGNCSGRTWIDPIFVYNHSVGASVTGGYVYRGSAIPELRGRYIYGDFISGTIWFLTKENGAWTNAKWPNDKIDTLKNISSFGEDANGELFVINYFNGTIYRITK